MVVCYSCSCNKKNMNENYIELKIMNTEVYSLKTDSIISYSDKMKYHGKENIDSKTIITFKLKNNTSRNYFFILDENNIESFNNSYYYQFDDCNYCKKSKLFSKIETNKKILAKYISFRGDSFQEIDKSTKNFESFEIDKQRHLLKELEVDVNEGDMEFSNALINKSFILHPNEVKYFRSVLHLPIDKEVNEYNNFYSYYILNNELNYNFSLIYVSDSLLLSKFLLKYKLEEIKQNNAEIYNGTLISNSIPVTPR